MGIYNQTNWKNLPNQTTPLNATNMNKIENTLGILSGGYIYEAGSNANGEYIKYSNGRALVWKRVSATFIATTSSGSMYTGTVSLGASPITFDDATKCRFFCQQKDMANLSLYVDGNTTTSLGTWHFMRATSTGSSGYAGYVDVFAIGHWDTSGISI